MTQDYIQAALRTETDYKAYFKNIQGNEIAFLDFLKRAEAVAEEADAWKKFLMYGKPRRVSFLRRFMETWLGFFFIAPRAVEMRDEKFRRLLHAALGFYTESGEIFTALRQYADGSKDLSHTNLIEEVGDVFWYTAIAVDSLGNDLSDILRRNIRKLFIRYPDKFTTENAIIRDLKAEYEVLTATQEGRR